MTKKEYEDLKKELMGAVHGLTQEKEKHSYISHEFYACTKALLDTVSAINELELSYSVSESRREDKVAYNRIEEIGKQLGEISARLTIMTNDENEYYENDVLDPVICSDKRKIGFA